MRVPLPVCPAGVLAGTAETVAGGVAPGAAITSTDETLNSGLVKPDVSEMVPAPGPLGASPTLCCARTRNHVTAKAAVYAALITLSRT